MFQNENRDGLNEGELSEFKGPDRIWAVLDTD